MILVLTGLPGSCLPKVKPAIGLDKVDHLLMYAGFAYVSLWGFRKPYQENGKRYQSKALWVVLVLSVVFGALTEVMQEALVPGRVGNVFDWIADVLGGALGVAAFYFFFRKRNNFQKTSLDK